MGFFFTIICVAPCKLHVAFLFLFLVIRHVVLLVYNINRYKYGVRSFLFIKTYFDILIIDKVGILADLYKFCTFAYVGSGFTTGVHSVIEPAVYGCTIGFGPNFNLLDEAKSMYQKNLCYIISCQQEMNEFITRFTREDNNLDIQTKLNDFILSSKVGTTKIIDYLNL